MYSASGELILAEATRLFYAEGIGAVGVDRVSAESGVSKPTLYAQFGNKDKLAAAVLQRRKAKWQKELQEVIDGLPADTDSRVLALFDRFARDHARPRFRGCPFIIAAAELPNSEHPARVPIAEYQAWIRGFLAELTRADGIATTDAEAMQLGEQFSLLLDGANAQVITLGDKKAMARARDIAAGIIAAHSTT